MRVRAADRQADGGHAEVHGRVAGSAHGFEFLGGGGHGGFDRSYLGPTVSRASLQADLANTGARATRLDARVRQLEKKRSEALGEKAWRESGLGAPDDVEQLKARIITLEQQVVDQRLQLEERAEELVAARATNRQLMTRLNSPRPAH
jgi:hypothetical protein